MTLHDFLAYLERHRATRDLAAQLGAVLGRRPALIPIPVRHAARDN